jgi:hydroxymethylpyrimidine pyrophosphatase-like HAD family hydrolase
VLAVGKVDAAKQLNAAMGNASDLLKSKAGKVVEDVEHDGFAKALNEFVLQY